MCTNDAEGWEIGDESRGSLLHGMVKGEEEREEQEIESEYPWGVFAGSTPGHGSEKTRLKEETEEAEIFYLESLKVLQNAESTLQTKKAEYLRFLEEERASLDDKIARVKDACIPGAQECKETSGTQRKEE